MRTKVQCKKCKRLISISNLSRHEKSCTEERQRRREKRIKVNENWLQTNGLYKCPFCDDEFVKKGLGFHLWKKHGEGKNKKVKFKNPIWSKGLTKHTDERVAKTAKSLKQTIKNNGHNWVGKHHTKETKEKLSKKMKIAHKEGRAHNIGQSRWNNKSSYPEKFFQKVIKNEFADKNYEREHPMGIYSLDFAWPHKKKAIEIDGQQHQRFEEYRERDKRKDEFATTEGWTILRLVWRQVFKQPKHYIKLANKFIGI